MIKCITCCIIEYRKEYMHNLKYKKNDNIKYKPICKDGQRLVR